MKLRFDYIIYLFSIVLVFSCNNADNKISNSDSFFKISLAQWSLNKMIIIDGKNPLDFPKEAKDLGFDAVELVSDLYSNKIKEIGFDNTIDSLATNLLKNKVECLLIMIDKEGDLAHPDESVRDKAVENHKRWVDAAARLGCHSIRVNTNGTTIEDLWLVAAEDGLRKLSTYAQSKKINVIVENHGGFSSHPEKLMQVINKLNLSNCGTLPDFGNWCIKRKENSEFCEIKYENYYKGIELMMPAAMAVSAKSYNFDKDGNETTIDYVKMLQIVKNSGYNGYIGIEYEGEELSEKDGVIATRELLLNAAKKLK